MHVIFQAAGGIASETWRLFTEAAPYLLFGLAVSGILEALVKRETVARHLGTPGIRSVLIAALIGIPLPLCSCGVIPTAISLRKSGASKGAILSFLISTPESDIDSIAISYALLDPLMTVFRVAAGMVSAIGAGVAENVFGKREAPAAAAAGARAGCVLCDLEEVHSHPLTEKLRHGIVYAFTDLLCDLSVWLALGIVISGIISYLVPGSFISRYLGYSFSSFLIMLAVGIPMYICASGSTPIAAALIAKGMSPGAALVFLLVGPATNAATVLMVGRFLGIRSAVIYLVSLSVSAILAGMLLNWIYLANGIDIRQQMGAGGEILPVPVKLISAAVLLFFMIRCHLVSHAHCRV